MKILVGLDESENALRAVEFVAHNFKPEHQVTIFSVFLEASVIYESISPGYFLSEQKSFCEMEDRKRNLLREAQENAKRILLRAGFQEKNITAKMRPKGRSIAEEIIHEAAEGYQLIVLGRRGLSRISEFFLGSISQKVLHGSKDATIMLIS